MPSLPRPTMPPARKRKNPALIVLLVVLGLAAVGFSGCGALLIIGSATPAPAARPSVPAAPPDGGSFDTPADLIAKAGSALPCGDAHAMTPIGARPQTGCDDGELVIRIYDDHSGVDDQINLLGIAGGADLLTGENWTLNAPKPVIVAAKKKLGGTYVHIGCESNC